MLLLGPLDLQKAGPFENPGKHFFFSGLICDFKVGDPSDCGDLTVFSLVGCFIFFQVGDIGDEPF